MSKRRIQFLVISTVAAILVVSPQIFAQPSSPVTPASPADATSFFNTTFWQNVAVAILSAVLAFLSGYALAGVSKKKGSGKKLSYNLSITNGVVQVDKEVKERVKILYNDELIDNLYNVEFELENTGDTVVKSQEIRFEFPEDTRILDFSFDPEPEPEMGATKIETGAGLKPHERKCRIGQIERGQKVGVQFAATNKADIQEVKIHPFNEIGDVEFSPREIAKQMSDKEQVTKFLIYSIFYLLIPPVFDSFPVLYGEIMAGVARLLILFNLFKLIAPFSEAIADLITHFSSFALDSEKGRYIDINGKVGESIIVTGDSNTVALYRDEDKGDEPDAA
jgi:hypothetical protein